MVLVKNWKFCERFVLCKIRPEKLFGDVLVRKQAFLDKKSKIGSFGKGLVHDFGQKVIIFTSSVFIKRDPEKVFADVVDNRDAFKDYKNNCVRKTQN